MTTIYLVRHGETFDNVRHIMQGQTHGQLNENGIKQAQELGKKLVVYISMRTYQAICNVVLTLVNGIVGERKASQIVCTQLLRERNWGSFTGRYIPELANLNNPSEWPDDIETLDELKQRAKHFLDWIKSEYPDKVILAVGHGIINKAIQSVFYDKPMNEIAVMKNADIRILQLI